jgi:hypothetical protein
MTATILNAAADASSNTLPFSLSAGTNRRIVIISNVVSSSGNVQRYTTMSLGGVAGRFDGGSQAATNYSRAAIGVWSWGETEIAAMVGSAIATTGGANIAVQQKIAYSIQGAAQSNTPTTVLDYSNPGTSTDNISLARTDSGHTLYAIGFANSVSPTMSNPAKVLGVSSYLHVGYQQDNAATSAVSSYTGNSGLVINNQVLVNYAQSTSQAISSVNGGNGVAIGSTGNIAMTTGFSGTPTAGSFGGKTITITGYNAGTGAVTFTAPSYVDGQTFPDPDATQTLILTRSSETASLNGIPHLEPLDSVSVTMAGLVTGNDHYLESWVPGLANGHKLVYPMEPTTSGNPATQTFFVYANGDWEAPTAGLRVLWWWNSSTQVMTQLNITFNEIGEIVSVDTSATAIPCRAITARALTATALPSRGI